MLIDLSSVARSLREDTFAASLARLRRLVAEQLLSTGTYTIQEGGRAFTITKTPQAGTEQQPR
jgi:hypothetical protein